MQQGKNKIWLLEWHNISDLKEEKSFSFVTCICVKTQYMSIFITVLLNEQSDNFRIYIHVVLWPKYSQPTWRSWNRASWYNCVNNQQDALYRLIYYSKSALHVSGDVFAHHQEHLTVFTVSGNVHPWCCRMVSWMSLNAISTHPRHQSAATWVNTTRYCKYSQVLLMMGENIARNTDSWLGIIN
jgi:hypothetical protein